MSGIKNAAMSIAALSWLMLAGCGTNSRIPEIRDASFSRAAAPAATDTHYEVRLGDTLYSIAWRYNIDYHDLARWNDIQPPYSVRTGQKLRLSAPSAVSATNAVQVKPLSGDDSMSVPANNEDDSWLVSAPAKAATSANVQSVMNVSDDRTAENAPATPTTKEVDGVAPTIPAALPEAKSVETPASSSDVSSKNAAKPVKSTAKAPDSSAHTSSDGWLWPTKGTVVGHFSDPSAITAGLDIVGQKGQPVVASRSGTVVYAGNGVRGYGNLVIIKHDDHFLSAYAHNDIVKVHLNDTVKAGQTIATMGDSEADRSKLHFEIRQDSQARDPQQFLPRS